MIRRAHLPSSSSPLLLVLILSMPSPSKDHRFWCNMKRVSGVFKRLSFTSRESLGIDGPISADGFSDEVGVDKLTGNPDIDRLRTLTRGKQMSRDDAAEVQQLMKKLVSEGMSMEMIMQTMKAPKTEAHTASSNPASAPSPAPQPEAFDPFGGAFGDLTLSAAPAPAATGAPVSTAASGIQPAAQQDDFFSFGPATAAVAPPSSQAPDSMFGATSTPPAALAPAPAPADPFSLVFARGVNPASPSHAKSQTVPTELARSGEAEAHALSPADVLAVSEPDPATSAEPTAKPLDDPFAGLDFLGAASPPVPPAPAQPQEAVTAVSQTPALAPAVLETIPVEPPAAISDPTCRQPPAPQFQGKPPGWVPPPPARRPSLESSTGGSLTSGRYGHPVPTALMQVDLCAEWAGWSDAAA